MRSSFMIAATGSGCGKTTITCALLAALKAEGKKVRSFKCGPDYIDPLFHKNVIGIPSKNLDLFFTDERTTRELFQLDNDSEVSIVEGVMGLYDGSNSQDDAGSSYHLACALDIPVVLVVDAHGMGRSILAVIRGFQAMDRQNRIAGVILNRISPMYYETIRPIIESELKIKVYGYYPKQQETPFESRYLGLKLPDEVENLREKIGRAAQTVRETIAIEELLELSKKNQDGERAGEECICTPVVRIAVARDEAFCFYYEDNLRLLQEAGAELVPFSPIHDTGLPENIDGILLGGGYPELHAVALEENRSMRQAVKEALCKGMPSLAECGGFMYLHDAIVVDKTAYKMVGTIQGSCNNVGKLIRFGYVSLEEKGNCFLKAGDTIRGHEFHYYDSTNNGKDALSTKPSTGRTWEAAHVNQDHWWGYAHLYYPSNPYFAKEFVEKCKEWKKNG